MTILIDGEIAEYQKGRNGFFWRVAGPSGLRVNIGEEEALECAIDYHETEGCALYLELYPAPEKGDWAFIAQDYSGKWWGYKAKPVIREAESVWTELGCKMSEYHISQSPPNPFWRKTLR